VSLDELKSELRITHASFDTDLRRKLRAAIGRVETVLGRKCITQVWDWTVGDLTTMEKNRDGLTFIRLPHPLQTVSGLWARDYAVGDVLVGTPILDEDDAVIGNTLYAWDADAQPGRLFRKPGQVWPTSPSYYGYRIRYVAGYGDAATAVPEIVRDAIMRTAVTLYRQPEDAVTGTIASSLPLDTLELLQSSGEMVYSL
jgi:uncharacterized phiE125 gp8 family phage protein